MSSLNKATDTVIVENKWKVEGCPLCGAVDVREASSAPDRFHGRQETYCLGRCLSCSCVWLMHPPTPKEMSFHYGHDYHLTIAAASETDIARRWHPHRNIILSHKRSGTVLDIGCSTGGFLSTMKGSGWRLYGIEMEPATAEKARAITGGEIFVGDVMDAPFASESFDAITCFDLLEHVYDPRQFLTQVMAWLKPGGILYTVLPNIDSWESRLFGSYWYGLELPRHLFHFSPRSLRHVTASVGLKEVTLSSNSTYIERSVDYLRIELFKMIGFSPDPPSSPRQGSLLWRATRKLIRVTTIIPFARLASIAGAGASIQAVFAKEARDSTFDTRLGPSPVRKW